MSDSPQTLLDEFMARRERRRVAAACLLAAQDAVMVEIAALNRTVDEILAKSPLRQIR